MMSLTRKLRVQSDIRPTGKKFAALLCCCEEVYNFKLTLQGRRAAPKRPAGHIDHACFTEQSFDADLRIITARCIHLRRVISNLCSRQLTDVASRETGWTFGQRGHCSAARKSTVTPVNMFEFVRASNAAVTNAVILRKTHVEYS